MSGSLETEPCDSLAICQILDVGEFLWIAHARGGGEFHSRSASGREVGRGLICVFGEGANTRGGKGVARPLFPTPHFIFFIGEGEADPRGKRSRADPPPPLSTVFIIESIFRGSHIHLYTVPYVSDTYVR